MCSSDLDEVLRRQLAGGLAGLSREAITAVAIAYEPVWAIGTGKAATSDQAISAHRTIRTFLSDTWSADLAHMTRILYGGSVTPQNLESFLQSEEIDGALIGWACLTVESFATICRLAESIGARR